MATVSFHSLLHSIPSLTPRLKSQKYPSLSAPFSNTFSLPKQQPLAIQISSITSRRISAYSSAPYTDSDTEFGWPDVEEELNDMEGETGEEEVMHVRPANPVKRLKKDRARLYVGNIAYSTTADDLTEIFSEAGTVASAEVIYDRVTDRSRGFAFVTMATVEEANEAIRMFDGSQLGGRSIKVNFPEVPRGAEREVLTVNTRPSRGYIDTAHKIYAGNLGWNVTSESLKEAFSHQSGLLGAKVIFDRETGRSRGFGFVTFASTEEAEAAIESMNGVEVEGRPLRLSFSNSGPSSRSTSQETVIKMQANSFETRPVSV